MATVPVTGTLSDFGGDLDESIEPRIVFRPNGAAVGASGLFHSRPIVVDTFGPGGTWTANLEPTDGLWHVTGSDVFYIVTVERLVGGADYFPWDNTGWMLRVPVDGGDFAALVRAPTNPRQIWFGPEPPADPSKWTGWYDTDADPGGINYYEWE